MKLRSPRWLLETVLEHLFAWLRFRLGLDRLEDQLSSLQRDRGIVPPPTIRDLDCGHRSSSYAIYVDGSTSCMDCHANSSG
jgi:hypothetical protein